MHPSASQQEDDSSIIKEQHVESKIDDYSKLDESVKLMNCDLSRKSSSYSIHRQGANNRRNLFEQDNFERLSKELSEFDCDNRWDELNEENINYDRQGHQKKGQYQNLEVQVPATKKKADLEALALDKKLINQKSDDETPLNKFQSPFSQKKFFDSNTYGYGSDDFFKGRSESQQESQNKNLNNNSVNSPYVDTPQRSTAKAKRQTHIAMKMKGVQSTIGQKAIQQQSDDFSKSPNSTLQRNTKVIQNQLIEQIQNTTQAIQTNLAIKENENNISNPLMDEKTIIQDRTLIQDRTVFQEEDNILEQPKKQHLIILTYMKRFINQLLKRLSYTKFDLLTEQHLEMIGDYSIPRQIYHKIIHNSHNVEYQFLDILSRRRVQNEEKSQRKLQPKQISFFSTISKQLKDNSNLKQFLSHIPIIQPQSLFLIIWESILLCILWFYLLFTPLKASFEFHLDQDQNFILYAYKIPVLIFFFDIILGFQTGYYELGRIVTQRKQIALRYIKKKFFTDFFCTIMMFFNIFFVKSNILEMSALIFRINQMKIKASIINDHFRIQNRYPTIYEMIKITSFILFMSHICGCGFHLVGQTADDGNNYLREGQTGSNKNWVENQGLTDVDWKTRYVFSVYFAIMTMITVGYGDIFPVNIYEKLYVIGMTIITCGVFAYCVNSISSIFSQLSQKSIAFKQKQYDLLNYMSQKNIKMDTQTKIMKYLDYLEEESDQCIAKGESILLQFPIELKEQVMREYFVKILKDVSILNENFSIAFLNAISLKMKEKRLGPGEKILIKNTKLSTLQFITKGSIEYSIEDGDYQRAICSVQSDKSVIDFRLFVTGMKSNISMQSSTMTNVAYISYADFIEELKRFHRDYEKFCYLRDQFLHDERFEKVCPSCNRYGHEIYNCPQIHYQFSTLKYKLDNEIQLLGLIKGGFHGETYTMKWAYIIDQHDLYQQVNIDEQMKVYESDRSFFKRCPKLRVDQIRTLQHAQMTKNVLDIIMEEDSVQSLSNSDCSDFQTEYSETQYNTKRNSSKRQTRLADDIYDSVNTNSEQQNMNMSTQNEQQLQQQIINEDPNSQNLSFLLDYEIGKLANDSAGLINNVNTGTHRRKSEVSLKIQEKPQYNTQPLQQQSTIRSMNRKLTQEVNDLDLNKIRRQSRKMTNRSLAQVLQAGQIAQNVERQSTNQNSFISYQDKGGINQFSSLSNSVSVYNGPMGQQINISPTNQDNFRQLDQMVEKFKRQCIRMMTKTLKQDFLSLPSDHYKARSQHTSNDGTQIQSISRASKLTNRNGTIVSVSQAKPRSEATIRSTQELPKQHTKNHDKENSNSKQRNYLSYKTQQHPSSHIFGPLQFKFDKIKEYLIYYPKGNVSNIIKIYKKIQQQQRQNVMKFINYKQKQSALSEYNVQPPPLEKHGISFSKKTAKMSRVSNASHQYLQ